MPCPLYINWLSAHFPPQGIGSIIGISSYFSFSSNETLLHYSLMSPYNSFVPLFPNYKQIFLLLLLLGANEETHELVNGRRQEAQILHYPGKFEKTLSKLSFSEGFSERHDGI